MKHLFPLFAVIALLTGTGSALAGNDIPSPEDANFKRYLNKQGEDLDAINRRIIRIKNDKEWAERRINPRIRNAVNGRYYREVEELESQLRAANELKDAAFKSNADSAWATMVEKQAQLEQVKLRSNLDPEKIAAKSEFETAAKRFLKSRKTSFSLRGKLGLAGAALVAAPIVYGAFSSEANAAETFSAPNAQNHDRTPVDIEAIESDSAVLSDK